MSFILAINGTEHIEIDSFREGLEHNPDTGVHNIFMECKAYNHTTSILSHLHAFTESNTIQSLALYDNENKLVYDFGAGYLFLAHATTEYEKENGEIVTSILFARGE